MRNIVLIGMPGSGKSTVGAALAQALGLPLADTDAMVEQAEGKSVAELFRVEGEPYFRARESEAARKAAALCGAVIATGGGIVLSEDNMRALRKTGTVFFLDRPPEDIVRGDLSDRPLIGDDRARVFRLYEQRISLYRKYADHIIENSKSPADAAERISCTMEREGTQP